MATKMVALCAGEAGEHLTVLKRQRKNRMREAGMDARETGLVEFWKVESRKRLWGRRDSLDLVRDAALQFTRNWYCVRAAYLGREVRTRARRNNGCSALWQNIELRLF